MIFDFELDESGDILIEKAQEINSSNIRFSICKNKPLRIRCGIRSHKSNKDGMFNISFNVNRSTNKYKFSVLKDEDVIKQRLLLKLKTLKGDIVHNPNEGSNIEMYKYENINENSIKALKIAIMKDISEEVKNARVVVKTVTNEAMSGYNIKIYSDNNLLLSHDEIL